MATNPVDIEVKNYTADDLYVAYFVGGIMRESQAGTMTEAWTQAVRRAIKAITEENRPTNKGVTTAEFERRFIAAKKEADGIQK